MYFPVVNKNPAEFWLSIWTSDDGVYNHEYGGAASRLLAHKMIRLAFIAASGAFIILGVICNLALHLKISAIHVKGLQDTNLNIRWVGSMTLEGCDRQNNPPDPFFFLKKKNFLSYLSQYITRIPSDSY